MKKSRVLPKNWEEKKLEELLEFVIGGDWGKDENYSVNCLEWYET